MEKGKLLVYFGTCMIGLFVGWASNGQVPEQSDSRVSFDRLYPRHPMDSVMQIAAHLWTEVEELVLAKRCDNRLCQQVRTTALDLHHQIQKLKNLEKISFDEQVYLAQIMGQLEPRVRQAHAKNSSCCFGNIAWLLEGIRQGT